MMPTPMTFSVWFVLLFALCAANFPFLNERLFGIFSLPLNKTEMEQYPQKSFSWRLVELLVFYLLTGLLAYLLEARLGHVQPQRWEFYAITLCLFIVFAYPGFVWRYLRRPSTQK